MQKIVIPKAKDIIMLERSMSGARLELAQEAFDVLYDAHLAKDDPILTWKLNNLKYLASGFDRVNKQTKFNDTIPAGTLRIKVNEDNYGLASVDVVTTAGVNYIVDSLQGLATINNLRWHASGTNNTAPAVGDTTLNTEVGTRVSGTQTEGASANIFRTVATLTYGSSFTIVEHGILSASSGGTLLDRSIFTGIGVDTTTSIEFTYDYTFSSGG